MLQRALLPSGPPAAWRQRPVGRVSAQSACPLLRSRGGRRAASGPAPAPRAAAAAGAPLGDGRAPAAGAAPSTAGPAAGLAAYVTRIGGLWRRFLPMLSLFFLLSFINTLLDSLKDTLVVTAAGGGAAVLPFLSLYAVLPASVGFLVVYSGASQRLSRATLFNTIIGCFSLFFAFFGFVLMPNAEALHLHELADGLQNVLPAGLAGGIGMVRNYVYTLFFVCAELWGDVCMGLLFWGLANDTTALADAPTLYPLFGLGANLAQAMAGLVLKATTAVREAGAANFTAQVQTTLVVVLAMAGAAAALHTWIATTSARPTNPTDLRPQPKAAAAAGGAAAGLERAGSGGAAASSSGAAASEQAAAGGDGHGSSGKAGSYPEPWRRDMLEEAGQQQQQQRPGSGHAGGPAPAPATPEPTAPRASMTMRETFAVLAGSVEIRCLAVMSLAQGLCTSLMEFTWKHHIRLLYPSPSAFTQFLGDVAVATGATTAALMLCSPLLFDFLGWRGVASATPQVLLWGGGAFFVAAITYQYQHGAAAAAAAAAGVTPTAGAPLLSLLVVAGALVVVLSKGAKFSLFKPAEEMVYITLNDDARTRGKAAIDVVGSQTGKSGGSILQQLLLVVFAGAVSGPIVPLLFACYLAMLRGWGGAVRELAHRRHYTLNSPVNTVGEEGGDDGPGAAGAAGAAAAARGSAAAVVVAPSRPAGMAAGGDVEAAELAACLQGLRDADPQEVDGAGGETSSAAGSVVGSGGGRGGEVPPG